MQKAKIVIGYMQQFIAVFSSVFHFHDGIWF